MSEIEDSAHSDASPVMSRHLLISGLVQGVGFRLPRAQLALGAGVVGKVRNLDDGRVEAALQGQRVAVERIEAWCQHGPELAPRAVR
jgi:acylphosphatase